MPVCSLVGEVCVRRMHGRGGARRHQGATVLVWQRERAAMREGIFATVVWDVARKYYVTQVCRLACVTQPRATQRAGV